jgi:hypothetical protein
VFQSPATVRDVCEDCNGGALSALDAYGKELDDQFFATFVKTPVSVTFRYSYDRLLRWLLKLSYNNARASNGSVREHQPLCRYILGLDDSPAYPIDLFLGIIAPVETTAAEQSRGLEKIAFPPALRFGWTKLPSTASAALRGAKCNERRLLLVRDLGLETTSRRDDSRCYDSSSDGEGSIRAAKAR